MTRSARYSATGFRAVIFLSRRSYGHARWTERKGTTRSVVPGRITQRMRFCRLSLRHEGVFGIGRLVVSLFPVSLFFSLFISRNRETTGDRFREHLGDEEKEDKHASKPVAGHLNFPNHSKQYMAVCGLSLHQGSTESRKTLDQKQPGQSRFLLESRKNIWKRTLPALNSSEQIGSWTFAVRLYSTIDVKLEETPIGPFSQTFVNVALDCFDMSETSQICSGHRGRGRRPC